MTLINYVIIGVFVFFLAMIEALRTPYKRKNKTDKNAKIKSIKKIKLDIKKNYDAEEKTYLY